MVAPIARARGKKVLPPPVRSGWDSRIGGHHHHDHGTGRLSDRALVLAISLNLGLSVFEFLAGLFAGSVALMADALHNTNDAAALVVAYVARRIARRGADETHTFGYRRAELIGALIQLTALILVGLYLVGEAVGRLFDPEGVKGGWMMAASGVAIVVDVATAWLLWSMSKGNLNLRAAFLHNVTDAAASVAVLLGGGIILWLGWSWVDPLLSLGIAGYILAMSFGLLRRTAKILMEGAPEGLDLGDLRSVALGIDGIHGIHHLHVWELDEDRRALEAHVVVAESTTAAERQRIRTALKEALRERFAIRHSTIELETAEHGCGESAGDRSDCSSPEKTGG